MNTLISTLFIVAVLANILLYKKAEDIWYEDAAKKVFWGTLIASFLLGASISADLGMDDSGFFTGLIVNLGLTSLFSFGFSRYDHSEVQILSFNISTPVKFVIDVVGFVASILGLSRFSDRDISDRSPTLKKSLEREGL